MIDWLKNCNAGRIQEKGFIVKGFICLLLVISSISFSEEVEKNKDVSREQIITLLDAGKQEEALEECFREFVKRVEEEFTDNNYKASSAWVAYELKIRRLNTVFLKKIDEELKEKSLFNVYLKGVAQSILSGPEDGEKLFRVVLEEKPNHKPATLRSLFYLRQSKNAEGFVSRLASIPSDLFQDDNITNHIIRLLRSDLFSKVSIGEKVEIFKKISDASSGARDIFLKEDIFEEILYLLEEGQTWKRKRIPPLFSNEKVKITDEEFLEAFAGFTSYYHDILAEIITFRISLSQSALSRLVYLTEKENGNLEPLYRKALELAESAPGAREKGRLPFGADPDSYKGMYAFIVEYAAESGNIAALRAAIENTQDAAIGELALRMALVKADANEFIRLYRSLFEKGGPFQLWMADSLVQAFQLREATPSLSEVYRDHFKVLLQSGSNDKIHHMRSLARVISADPVTFREEKQLREFIAFVFELGFPEGERKQLAAVPIGQSAEMILSKSGRKSYKNIQYFLAGLKLGLERDLYVNALLTEYCPAMNLFNRPNFPRNITKKDVDDLLKIKQFTGTFEQFNPIFTTPGSHYYGTFLYLLRKKLGYAISELHKKPESFGNRLTLELLQEQEAQAVLKAAGAYRDEIKAAPYFLHRTFYNLYHDYARKREVDVQILGPDEKEILTFLEEVQYRIQLDKYDPFITRQPESSHSVSMYVDKGTEIFLAIFRKHPEKARTLIRTMVSTLKELEKTAGPESEYIWNRIFRKAGENRELVEFFLSVISHEDHALADIASEKSSKIIEVTRTFEDLKDLPFGKDFPFFFTCSGSKKSGLQKLIRKVATDPDIYENLKALEVKPAGISILLECVEQINHLDTKFPMILEAYSDSFSALSSSQRQDFYRFYEIVTEGKIKLSDADLTFFRFYWKERPASLRQILERAKTRLSKKHFVRMRAGEYANLLTVLGEGYYVEDLLRGLLLNEEEKRQKNRILDSFTVSQDHVSVEHRHLMIRLYFDVNGELPRQSGRKTLWVSKPDEFLTFGRELSYPEYLSAKPEAFLQLPLAGNISSFSTIPFRKDLTHGNMFGALLTTLKSASPERKNHFQQIISRTKRTFGTELFLSLTNSQAYPIASFFEKYGDDIEFIPRNQRLIFCNELAGTFYSEIRAGCPDFSRLIINELKEEIIQKIDQFLQTGTFSGEYSVTRQAVDLLKSAIFIVPEKADELLEQASEKAAELGHRNKNITAQFILEGLNKEFKSNHIFFWSVERARKLASKSYYQKLLNHPLELGLKVSGSSCADLIGTPTFAPNEAFRFYYDEKVAVPLIIIVARELKKEENASLRNDILAELEKRRPDAFCRKLLLTFLNAPDIRYANAFFDCFGENLAAVQEMSVDAKAAIFKYSDYLMKSRIRGFDENTLSENGWRFLDYLPKARNENLYKTIDKFLNEDPPEKDPEYIRKNAPLALKAFHLNDAQTADKVIDKLVQTIGEKRELEQFTFSVLRSLDRDKKNPEWLFLLYKNAHKNKCTEAVAELAGSYRLFSSLADNPERFSELPYYSDFTKFSSAASPQSLQSGYGKLISMIRKDRQRITALSEYFDKQDTQTFGTDLTKALLESQNEKELYRTCLEFLADYCLENEIKPDDKVFQLLETFSPFSSPLDSLSFSENAEHLDAEFRKWMLTHLSLKKS